MVLLPEVMQALVQAVGDAVPALSEGLAYVKQMAIGLAIILFLIFEPDGLAHRWKQTKAYWKLYPFSY
jgi:branched-chain amino acid transport system permease protein